MYTLAGNIDRHAFPHIMVYHNEKSLGPFRPADLDVQARPGPARGPPGPLPSLITIICKKNCTVQTLIPLYRNPNIVSYNSLIPGRAVPCLNYKNFAGGPGRKVRPG